MTGFNPKFTITHRMTSAITQIERTRGFLEAARLSDDWVRDMGNQALIKEAHHTTHIEGTRLTLDQAQRLWKGEAVPEADPDDTRELLNYRSAIEIPIMMSEMVKWINSNLEIHPVLISGIAQFQLVHIHPFLDGNGQTSRLLSTLCLYKAGYDFKRLFTISEYYDRDRPTFYKKIQSVRDNDMDMTGWLDYFITGLETQMIEVKERGEQVIRRDVLTQKHNLNERQTKAIEYILRYDRLTIQDYEVLCPDVNRRSLQRDLKIMIEKELIGSEGATNQLVYFLRV